jgi:hypothetical protein
MAYSDDADIIAIRPNITSLGVADWSDMHDKAAEKINRVIIRRWYKDAAAEYSLDWRDTEFNSALVEANTLKDLSCFKTLELCYMYLMKDSPEPDGFEREMNLFRKLYNQELEEILAIGIGYDWDGSGAVVDTEKYQRIPRRLTRV